jgi:acetyl-CoA synthetase
VFCPLFSSFGPEPVHQRLTRGDGKVLVTTAALYRKRVAAQRDQLPALEHVLIVDAAEGEVEGPGVHALGPLLEAASPTYEIGPTDPEDPALLHFTSGTTGNPKGALHVHRAVVAHHASGRFALDLHPDDTYWCTADPGWVTGTSYGIISPLTHGVTTIVDMGEFDARRWYGILQDQQVDVWYTAPTAIRMLMKAGGEVAEGYDLSKRAVRGLGGRAAQPRGGGVGRRGARPAHPRQLVADRDRRDHGGQLRRVRHQARLDGSPDARHRGGARGGGRRTGADRSMPTGAPGSSPSPAPRGCWPCGWGGPRCSGPTSTTRSATRSASRATGTSRATWRRATRTAGCGSSGRGDDVIKTAGHLVGPFELESVFMEHPAVVEAAVIGLPDPVAGNVLKAFVTLAPGHEESDALRRELLGFGRKRLGAIAPREVAFHANLPKTRSGKIMRRLLRARELGLPEGDLSTLETGPDRPHQPPDRGAPVTDHATPEDPRWACCARWSASAASRSAASSCTPPPRSAASCTSTSARRRSPPA